MDTITGTERGDAALDFFRHNPDTRKEEVVRAFGLTLEEAASVVDAFESWIACMED